MFVGVLFEYLTKDREKLTKERFALINIIVFNNY